MENRLTFMTVYMSTKSTQSVFNILEVLHKILLYILVAVESHSTLTKTPNQRNNQSFEYLGKFKNKIEITQKPFLGLIRAKTITINFMQVYLNCALISCT